MNESLPELAAPSRAKGSNLACALFCLPADRRKDAMTFYHFCRAVDDIADDEHLSETEKSTRLVAWKNALESGTSLPAALAELLDRRQLDRVHFLEIIRGCEMDIQPRHYATWEDLRGYCWRVASAVGLVSIEIFGCQEVKSRLYAENLGLALQLTNILRDVSEDSGMGRIYLPLEDLSRFGVSEKSLLARRPDGDFTGLMKFEAQRATQLYREAVANLTPGDRQALIPAEIMRAIYQKILHRMETDGFPVFKTRYRLSRAEKLLTALAILLRQRMNFQSVWPSP